MKLSDPQIGADGSRSLSNESNRADGGRTAKKLAQIAGISESAMNFQW